MGPHWTDWTGKLRYDLLTGVDQTNLLPDRTAIYETAALPVSYTGLRRLIWARKALKL
jgi:hypothetical protein